MTNPEQCKNKSTIQGYLCTLRKGHDGSHEARNLAGYLFHRWHRGDTAGAGEPLRTPSPAALASGVTEPGTLEQQAWNLYYDRHAKVAEEIVESLMIFAAPLRERVAELERELESIADFANGEGDVGNIIARRARAALSPDSQDGKKGNE